MHSCRPRQNTLLSCQTYHTDLSARSVSSLPGGVCCHAHSGMVRDACRLRRLEGSCVHAMSPQDDQQLIEGRPAGASTIKAVG